MNKERIKRVMDVMTAAGVSQLVVSDTMVIYYLTGIKIWPGERLLALVIDRSSRHFAMINELFPAGKKLELEQVWYNDVQDGVAIMAEKMDDTGVIGIDKNWPARFLLRLQELKPNARFVNSSDIIDGVRRIKDAEEQRLMIESSAANDRVMAKFIPYLSQSYTELELDALLRKLYEEEDCEGLSFPPIASFAKNAADPHHGPDNTRGKRGDCVVIDIGGLKSGYCSDMTRTVFLGKVSDRQREIYEIVKEANLRGIAAAKPGNRMCDVDLAARNYIEEKGFGKYFTHRTGHSIGLEDHEAGDVSSVNTDVIKPGQCFSVEPGIYIAEEGIGVRIEDLVLITENGSRVLNSYTKDLIVVPFED